MSRRLRKWFMQTGAIGFLAWKSWHDEGAGACICALTPNLVAALANLQRDDFSRHPRPALSASSCSARMQQHEDGGLRLALARRTRARARATNCARHRVPSSVGSSPAARTGRVMGFVTEVVSGLEVSGPSHLATGVGNYPAEGVWPRARLLPLSSFPSSSDRCSPTLRRLSRRGSSLT